MAEVLSSRAGNDTSTIDKALPDGTKLYTTPPAVPAPKNDNQILLDGNGFTTDGQWRLVPVEPSAEQRLASKRYKAKNKIPTGPGFYRAMVGCDLKRE
ncbi:hypothetical protein [Serratia sp. CC22-02]|uniref:hypothetical protein n=1 Tax=Serratia sp. CC22-02 TaxID=1378076 RepID=UPI0024B6E330|nr:hypothetical protein [Serratia sp. CC22-02]